MTKKIMVVDPGHDEGSRSAETLCSVQDGVPVVEAKDISPNLNGNVILASENTGNPLLESIKVFEQLEILESGLQQRRDRDVAVLKENHERMFDGAIDILKHWDKVTRETEGESCTLTRKSLRALRRSWGLDGKSRKRLRKKEEHEINLRDRKFRDRTRKLVLVLMGESDNIRRYVFSAVMPRSKYPVTLDIVNKEVPFLDVWNKEV